MFPKVPESESAHFEQIRQQKEQELRSLVQNYGGAMIHHPEEQDINLMANYQAFVGIGLSLSPELEKAAKKLSNKFKGSFC